MFRAREEELVQQQIPVEENSLSEKSNESRLGNTSAVQLASKTKLERNSSFLKSLPAGAAPSPTLSRHSKQSKHSKQLDEEEKKSPIRPNPARSLRSPASLHYQELMLYLPQKLVVALSDISPSGAKTPSPPSSATSLRPERPPSPKY